MTEAGSLVWEESGRVMDGNVAFRRGAGSVGIRMCSVTDILSSNDQ